MEKIFSQEELYWLDDILPGTKLTRIRRLSFTRNVHKTDPIPNQEVNLPLRLFPTISSLIHSVYLQLST